MRVSTRVNNVWTSALLHKGAGGVTQLFYGIVAPGNKTTNLATASLTAEVVSNASNLLMDIKPGYMLGAKPRQQQLSDGKRITVSD